MAKIEFNDVPYRKWRGRKDSTFLRSTEVYRKVMARVGPFIKAGQSVQMEHKIVCDGSKKLNSTYDTVSFKIGR